MGEWFSVAWAVWAIFTLLTFAALEAWAVVTDTAKTRNTLTEQLRTWLGVQPRRWWRLAGAALLVTFCAWLPLHILVPSFPL